MFGPGTFLEKEKTAGGEYGTDGSRDLLWKPSQIDSRLPLQQQHTGFSDDIVRLWAMGGSPQRRVPARVAAAKWMKVPHNVHSILIKTGRHSF